MNFYIQRQEERKAKLKAKLIEVSVFAGTLVVMASGLYIYICKPFEKTNTVQSPNYGESYSEVLATLNQEAIVTLQGKSNDVYIALSKTTNRSKTEFQLTVDEINEELSKLEPLNIENPFENATYQNIPYSSESFSGDLQISNEDYEVLLRITEAEAGGEDEQGKRMVVHTILNRVTSKKFPNTVKEVVFQMNSSGTYQYTPITNGRYFKVTPSESTTEAVNQAIQLYTSGTDETEGAEFFMSPSAIKYDTASSERGANWQRDNLVLTVTHGTHEFRKYP